MSEDMIRGAFSHEARAQARARLGRGGAHSAFTSAAAGGASAGTATSAGSSAGAGASPPSAARSTPPAPSVQPHHTVTALRSIYQHVIVI